MNAAEGLKEEEVREKEKEGEGEKEDEEGKRDTQKVSSRWLQNEPHPHTLQAD